MIMKLKYEAYISQLGLPNKYHRLGGLSNNNFFLIILEQKVEGQVLAWLVSGETSYLGS